MLDFFTSPFKKGAKYVGAKLAKTEAGINALKQEMAKMPIPPHMKAMFTKILDNNPDLLFKIQDEIEAEVKKGKNQMQASQSIMMKYQKELRDAMK